MSQQGETKRLVELYLSEKKGVIDAFPIEDVVRLADTVWQVYQTNGVVYSCGNGGNVGLVSNLVTDWSQHPFVSDDKSKPLPDDIPRMKVGNLTSDMATITAILNDMGSDYIFSRQLQNDGVDHGDLLLAFTGSGNSPNVLEAMRVAKDLGAKTVTISRGTGGKARDLVDQCIIIPGESKFPGQVGGNNNNFHYEDAAMTITHMVSGILRDRVMKHHLSE